MVVVVVVFVAVVVVVVVGFDDVGAGGSLLFGRVDLIVVCVDAAESHRLFLVVIVFVVVLC